MSLSFDKQVLERGDELVPPPTLLPEPVPAAAPVTTVTTPQSSLGNSAVANATKNSPTVSPHIAQLQSGYGNAALSHAAVSGSFNQPSMRGGDQPPSGVSNGARETNHVSRAFVGNSAPVAPGPAPAETGSGNQDLRQRRGLRSPIPSEDELPRHEVVPPPAALDQSPIRAAETPAPIEATATSEASPPAGGSEAAPTSNVEAPTEAQVGPAAPAGGEVGVSAGAVPPGDQSGPDSQPAISEVSELLAPVPPVVDIADLSAPADESSEAGVYDPEQAGREVQARVATFAASIGAKRATIIAEVSAAQQTINLLLDQQLAAVQAAARASIESTHNSFTEARANASVSISAARDQIHANAQQHLTDVQAVCDERRGEVQTIASDHIARIQTANDSHDPRVREAVQEQVRRGADGTRTQAQAARQAGRTRASQLRDEDPEVRAAKAEADITVANDTAAKLEEKIPELQEGANGLIEPVLGRFNEEAGDLPQTIREQATGVVERFPELLTNEQQAVAALLEQADADLAAAEANIMSQLEQGETTIVASIETSLAAAVAQIESTRTMTLQQVHTYGLVADEALAGFENSVTEAVLAESRPQISAIDNALASADSATEEPLAQFRAALASTIEAIQSGSSEASAGFTDQLQAATGAVHNSIQQTKSEQENLLFATAERVQVELEARRSTLEAKLAEAVGNINAQFEELVVNFEQAVTRSVNETQTQAAASVDELLLANQQNVQALWGMSPNGKFAEAEANVQRTAWDYFLEGFNVAMFVVGLLVLVAIVIIAAVLSLKAAIIVGLIVLVVGAIWSIVTRVRSLLAADAPWWVWVIYGLTSGIHLILDITGLGALIEASVGYDTVTFQKLSPEERWRRFGAGVAGVILTLLSVGIGKFVLPRFGTPRVAPVVDPLDPIRPIEPIEPVDPIKPVDPIEPPPPRVRPYDPTTRTDAELLLDRIPTPREGETPAQAAERARLAENEILDRLTRPYDPSKRTDAELQLDRDPTPRQGETPEHAARRARMAEEEIELRRQLSIIEGLGEEPRQVDVRADDATHASRGAHTTDRHGSNITLEMPRDSAGNRLPVPTGVKSIEGRIFGDTGWPSAENNSFRWKSDAIMNETVNKYIRDNWTQIKEDLAATGQHSNNFNATKGAIGEGFFDPNQTLPGPRAPEAVFMETSLVRITLRLIPGSPPDFFIVTTFPNALGAPVR